MLNLSRYLFLLVPLCLFAPPVCFSTEAEDSQKEQAEIAKLIEALGSSNYSTRYEAEDALKNLGVKALDQLNVAKNHSNLQIAALARYLLNSTGTVWFYEGDSPRISKLLKDYAIESPLNRDSILLVLSKLEADEGVPALARIARYEHNGDLSKRAALRLMGLSDAHVKAEQLTHRWDAIRKVSAEGNNTACKWLNRCADVYSRSLAQHSKQYRQDMKSITQDIVLLKPFDDYEYRALPLSLMKFTSFYIRLIPDEQESQWWKDQIDSEIKLLKMPSEDTSITIVEGLAQRGCEYLLRCERKDQAVELGRLLLDVPASSSEPKSILQRANWAIDYGMPQLATEMIIKAGDEAAAKSAKASKLEGIDMLQAYYDSAYWKYHLAESYLWQGRLEEANKLADEAMHSPKYSETYPMYIHLQGRMMYQWAINEFQNDNRARTAGSEKGKLYATVIYLTYFQEGPNYLNAIDTAGKIIERMDSEPKYADEVKQWLQDWSIEVDVFRGSYLFAKAKLQIKRGEIDAAKLNLRDAYKLQPDNVDALIELHNIHGDAVYEKEIGDLLDKELASLLADSKQHEAEMHSATPDKVIALKKEFANSLNTYAWVLCNTGRDLDNALQISIESNRLYKDSAEYTDTLARCYFVKGDLENAIYWQEQSFSLKPGQSQLLRTLLEYQDAAARKPLQN